VKFFLDHDVPDDVARSLANLNYEVVCLREVLPVTASDAEAFAYACDRGFLLLTCNRNDFLELAGRRIHAGVIILIRRTTRQAEVAHLARLIKNAGEEGLRGNINFA
jgi:predicted nuclease of predicted toxin-antitoxin system